MSERRSATPRVMREIHEAARDLLDAGVIDVITMREFDALCVKPVRKYKPAQIRRIRAKSRSSQAVFAAMLNVRKATVAAWEQGTKSPSGPALKLLEIVERKGLEALV
jgi:putative transcriptional regulator